MPMSELTPTIEFEFEVVKSRSEQETYRSGPAHALAWQVWYDAQAVPQAPQFCWFCARLKQPPSQAVSPWPHAHVPSTQMPPGWHCWPQPPQLVGSVRLSTHEPPQSRMPPPSGEPPSAPAQKAAQLLAEQTSPVGQALPQEPQSLTSEVRSTQTPEQAVRPVSQTQRLAWQSSPLKQALPQAPQLSASVWVLVQSALHAVCPEGQAQAPAAHLCPAGQVAPQLPQFFGSVAVSTQLPLQVTVFPVQVAGVVGGQAVANSPTRDSGSR
jgi:hypothetical protein